MNNFKELIVWKKARLIVKSIYTITLKLPVDEKFGLISQIRRCAISIPSNIAEGASRASEKEFAHFLEIAYGSSFELETQLLLCVDIEFLQNEEVSLIISDIQEVQKIIYTLIKNKRILNK
ncbi:MAG: four helix bundle protein [Bacteroidetes bacterium]|jgi:four helix bundle protein|nr:four helix bundle protein [Bacteroidota bacterium]